MNIYQKYIEAGFGVIPASGGIPSLKWGQYQNTLPTLDEAANWHGDVVLICGGASNIVALDKDTDDALIISRIEAMSGISPVKKKGSKGYTSFFQYRGEKSKQWKLDGVVVLELLSDKRLTTIPPSNHRITKKPYEWIGGTELIGAQLPILPPNFIAVMDAIFPAPIVHYPDLPRYVHNENIELDQVEAMLSHINPDCSREEWLRIGMALRDEFGDVACNLWHKWSAGAPAKYKQKDAQTAWRSFFNTGVTIGTLVFMARQNGFVFAGESRPTPPVKLHAPAKQEIRAHGLVQEIADWITETAGFPMPMLSLGAALAFVSMLKGHCIEGGTELRTNNLILNMAPTGAGKDHPQKCLHKLVAATMRAKNIMGEPVAGGAFLTGLRDAGRVGFLIMDEIGHYIGNITNKNAGSHQKEIIGYILKTFSCASTMIAGRQYTDNKKNPRIDIIQPHFVCIGSTVHERMKDACTSSDVVDGFLNRWIIFNVKKRVERSPQRKKAIPPPELVEKIMGMVKPEYDSYGEPILAEIKFTAEAWEIFTRHRQEIDNLIATASYPMDRLYVRTSEHVEKIALTLCDDRWIFPQDVEAAIAIISESNRCIMEFTGLISDNVFEKDFIRVREIIKEAGEIKKSALTLRCQFVQGGAKRVREIVEALMDANIIAEHKHLNGVIYTYL